MIRRRTVENVFFHRKAFTDSWLSNIFFISRKINVINTFPYRRRRRFLFLCVRFVVRKNTYASLLIGTRRRKCKNRECPVKIETGGQSCRTVKRGSIRILNGWMDSRGFMKFHLSFAISRPRKYFWFLIEIPKLIEVQTQSAKDLLQTKVYWFIFNSCRLYQREFTVERHWVLKTLVRRPRN